MTLENKKTKERKKKMTQKHFESFAAYIAEFRARAKECSNMEDESSLALEQANACEGMVIEIAKEFNSKFNTKRFLKACQPKT